MPENFARPFLMVYKGDGIYLLLCQRPICKTGSNDVHFKGSCLMSFEPIFKRCKQIKLELFTDSSVQLFETRQFHVSCNGMQGT